MLSYRSERYIKSGFNQRIAPDTRVQNKLYLNSRTANSYLYGQLVAIVKLGRHLVVGMEKEG